MEIAVILLLHSAIGKCDLLAQRGAERVDHAALHLVFRARQVDDVLADIGRHPHVMHLHAAITRHAGFDHIGEIAEVAEVEGDAQTATRWQLAPPAGHFGGLVQHAAHAPGVVGGALHRLAGLAAELLGDRNGAWASQHATAILQRVTPGRNRAIVDEALGDEGKGVVDRRAQPAQRGCDRQHRHIGAEILDHARRKQRAIDHGGGVQRTIGAEADEMIVPGDDVAFLVQPGFQLVPATGAQPVVGEILCAVPLQFHRHAGGIGDHRGFHGKIIHQPPAETTAGSHQMDGDIFHLQAQRQRHHAACVFRRLRRKPQLGLVACNMGGGVDRLQRGVGQEGIAVIRCHLLRSGRHLGRRIAVVHVTWLLRAILERLGCGGFPCGG